MAWDLAIQFDDVGPIFMHSIFIVMWSILKGLIKLLVTIVCFMVSYKSDDRGKTNA